MKIRQQTFIVQIIWLVLVISFLVSIAMGRWSITFVSAATLILSMAPTLLAERFHLRLPISLVAIIVVFVFSTLFLGEVFDFYERYWWWDVVLHGGSAIAFGMIGFLFIFYLFEGDRFAAPPIAMTFIAFCFAITIGAMWEIFEFSMDQLFGLNMQKSGLIDTMWDLIVDVIGASLGSFVGFFYLKGLELGGLGGVISEFVRLNKNMFRKLK